MPLDTLRTIAIEKSRKQPKQIDFLTEEAPILDLLPFTASTHDMWHAADQLEAADAMGFVAMDQPLPEVGSTSRLIKFDLSKMGGVIEVGEDKAKQYGGMEKYFADKTGPVLKVTGMNTERVIVYDNLRQYALDKVLAGETAKTVYSAGGSANANYSIVAARFEEGVCSGLYNSKGFGNGVMFDTLPINGGNVYKIAAGTLVYGVRMKCDLGFMVAGTRNVGAIVNIDNLDNLEATTLGQTADPWKPIAKAEFDRKRASFTAKISANMRNQIEAETNTSLGSIAEATTRRAATAAYDGDAVELANIMRKHEAAIDARTDLDAEAKEKTRLGFRSGVATQAALGELDRAHKAGGLEEAARFVDDFAAGRAGGGGKLAEDKREPIVRSLKARVEDLDAADRLAKAQAETQRRQARTQRLDAVTKAIDAGQYGQADLERDAQAGLFADAPEAVRTFTRAITQRHDREEARQRDLQRVNDAQAGKAVLDPADPEDRKAVDTWWKARRDADPKGALTDAAAIARRLQILPAAAGEGILDALIYGTPERQAEAAKALDALDQDAPAVADTLPLAARTRADVIGRALAQGRDAPAAAAIAEQLLGPATGLAKDAARAEPMGRVTLLAHVTTATGKDDAQPDIADQSSDKAKPGVDGGEADPGNWGADAWLDLSGMVPDAPEDAPDELTRAVGETLLGLVPGVGEALSAKDAYDAFVAAREALHDDKLAEAIEYGGLAALGALGAIPVAGKLVKLGEGGVKVARAALKMLRSQSRRVVETAARAGRSASDEWFAKWARDILDNPKLANHGAARVGRMRSEVQDFLKSKDVDLPNDGIDVTDDHLLHMNRESKPANKRVPQEMIERIPEALRNPDEVLWDGKSLLYVRHLEGDEIVKSVRAADSRDRAKYVVRVDVDADFQRGDKRVQRRGNWILSAGRVPGHNLDALERVWP